MGVSYSPILYLGRAFKSEECALEFYQRHFKLSEQDLKDIEADGFGGVGVWASNPLLYTHKLLHRH